MKDSITAIIVNYHTNELTGRALASFLEQECSIPLKAVIIDNSTDKNERDQLSKLGGEQVEVIFSSENIGYGKASNVALTATDSKYILLLNSDAYLQKTSLEKLLKALKMGTNIAAVSPKIYWDDAGTMSLPPIFPVTPFTIAMESLINKSRRLSGVYSTIRRKQTLDYVSSKRIVRQKNLPASAVLLKRDVVEMVGGLFDERFFMYYEDSDLFLRIRKAGYSLLVEPHAMAIHNYNQSGSEAEGCIKARYMLDSRKEFLKKYDKTGIWTCIMKFADSPRKKFGKSDISDVIALHEENRQVPVPLGLTGSWVLELSPNPNMVPSAMLFGEGNKARIDDNLWKWMRPGAYFLRLGGLGVFPENLQYRVVKTVETQR